MSLTIVFEFLFTAFTKFLLSTAILLGLPVKIPGVVALMLIFRTFQFIVLASSKTFVMALTNFA